MMCFLVDLLTPFLYGVLVRKKKKGGIAVRNKIAWKERVETLENYNVYI